VIGANSLVVTDVEDNHSAVGVPAQVLRFAVSPSAPEAAAAAPPDAPDRP
jgi:serine acetyltransferase